MRPVSLTRQSLRPTVLTKGHLALLCEKVSWRDTYFQVCDKHLNIGRNGPDVFRDLPVNGDVEMVARDLNPQSVASQLARRGVLQGAGLTAAAAVLAACTSQAKTQTSSGRGSVGL